MMMFMTNSGIAIVGYNTKALKIKRLLDIFIALCGLIVFSPILLGVAILIKFETHGPVLYRQWRVGKDKRLFQMIKFRTMHHDSEGQLEVLFEETLQDDPSSKMDWDEYQKLWNDPRLTRVGQYLRRYSIDELPQLWNVLKGDMSLVGPRPILPDQASLYGSALHRTIQVMPGMTGLWQINGRNLTSFSERVMWDLEYIDRWSLWLDIYILFVTCWVVARGEGAY